MAVDLDKFYKSQGLDSVADSLAHWGIKGMRWGVRRSDEELARARGESTDAIRAKETLQAISKAHSLSAASDADLQHLVNRMNLEKRYAEVNPSVLEKGHKSVQTLLKAGETMNKAYTFANSPAGKILAGGLGLYKVGPGKHAKIPTNVIDLPGATKIGRHRKP